MSLSRRDLLAAGAGAALAGALPALASAAVHSGAPVLLFDPAIPESRTLALALRAPGQALTPIEGDPMRFWRDRLAAAASPVAGVTRWSDFLVLSELARDHRLRVVRQTHHPVKGAPLLVSWAFG